MNVKRIGIRSMCINMIQKIWNKEWKFYNPLYVLIFPISVMYFCCYNFKLYITKTQKIKNLYTICIGNITVGGGGKTPTALSLAQYILTKYPKIKVAFISTGYKGRDISKNHVIKVKIDKHSAKQVGDEPLLLASLLPTYVSKSRVMAACKAKQDGANLVIMDDGIQDNSIHKDLIITVIDSKFLLGNSCLLPIGPLRTTLKWAISKTNILIFTSSKYINNGVSIINKSEQKDLSTLDKNLGNLCEEKNRYFQSFNNKLKTTSGYTFIININKLNNIISQNKPIFALIGIAHPEKFIQLLKSVNISPNEVFVFPDHHNYSDEEIKNIIRIVKKIDGTLLTTTKDSVRIPKKFLCYFCIVEIFMTIDWHEIDILEEMMQTI